jgi:hypothetical protein
VSNFKESHRLILILSGYLSTYVCLEWDGKNKVKITCPFGFFNIMSMLQWIKTVSIRPFLFFCYGK